MSYTKKEAQIVRQRINKRMQATVNQANRDIFSLFKSIGVNYVPFTLLYNEYEVLTDRSKRKPVKNVSLIIDPDFMQKLFEDKISFSTWLSRNHPTIARQKWKADNLGHREPDLSRYKRKFYQEVGDNAKPNLDRSKIKSKGGRINQKKSVIVGYVREKSNPEKPEERIFQKFTGRDVQKFMENEDFIFKGNLKTYFKYTSDKRVKDILKTALTQFNKAFMDLNLTELDPKEDNATHDLNFQAYMNKKRKGEDLTEDEKHAKFLSEIEGMKQQWKLRPKFPNINNIRDWFIRTGIYSSYKLEEFQQIKTVKGRMNWIDRSVFLIANGIYANALGQNTASWSGKYKQSAGAKIPISKARKYQKRAEGREKYRTEREMKYEQWRIDNRKLARGWKNRGSQYSRINRKRGNSRAQADSRRDDRV